MRLAQVAEHPPVCEPGPSTSLGDGQSQILEIREVWRISPPLLAASLGARTHDRTRLRARTRGNQ